MLKRILKDDALITMDSEIRYGKNKSRTTLAQLDDIAKNARKDYPI